jgi:hypothetical protein
MGEFYEIQSEGRVWLVENSGLIWKKWFIYFDNQKQAILGLQDRENFKQRLRTKDVEKHLNEELNTPARDIRSIHQFEGKIVRFFTQFVNAESKFGDVAEFVWATKGEERGIVNAQRSSNTSPILKWRKVEDPKNVASKKAISGQEYNFDDMGFSRA